MRQRGDDSAKVLTREIGCQREKVMIERDKDMRR